MIRGLQHKWIIKSLAWILMAHMVLLIANQAMFIHTHRMSDGTIVVHAHPFKSTGNANQPFKSHKHSSYDYVLLDNLTHFLVTSIGLFLVFFTLKSEKHHKKALESSYQADVVHPSLRAPPACCYILT